MRKDLKSTHLTSGEKGHMRRIEFVLDSFVRNHHSKMMAYRKGLSNMLVCVMKVLQILQILITVKKIGLIEKLRHKL
jgi:hypothetical protein